MAARKKAKPKRKAPARKPVARKKAPAIKKKVAKKKPTPRPARVLKAQPVRAPSQPAKPAAPPAAPAPLAGEERVGTVTHYFGHLSVAAVRMETGRLRIGDTIHVVGRTSDFRQRLASLQDEHETASGVSAGHEIRLK